VRRQHGGRLISAYVTFPVNLAPMMYVGMQAATIFR